MSPIKRFKRTIKKSTDSVRKEKARSSLRRQLFYENQISAMTKWQQKIAVAWK